MKKAKDILNLTNATWGVIGLAIILVFVAIVLLGFFVSLVDFAVYNVVDLLTWLVKGAK